MQMHREELTIVFEHRTKVTTKLLEQRIEERGLGWELRNVNREKRVYITTPNGATRTFSGTLEAVAYELGLITHDEFLQIRRNRGEDISALQGAIPNSEETDIADPPRNFDLPWRTQTTQEWEYRIFLLRERAERQGSNHLRRELVSLARKMFNLIEACDLMYESKLMSPAELNSFFRSHFKDIQTSFTKIEGF